MTVKCLFSVAIGDEIIDKRDNTKKYIRIYDFDFHLPKFLCRIISKVFKCFVLKTLHGMLFVDIRLKRKRPNYVGIGVLDRHIRCVDAGRISPKLLPYFGIVSPKPTLVSTPRYDHEEIAGGVLNFFKMLYGEMDVGGIVVPTSLRLKYYFTTR